MKKTESILLHSRYTLDFTVAYSPMYNMPEVYFRIFELATSRMLLAEEATAIIAGMLHEESMKDSGFYLDTKGQKFFISAKSHPCKGGIYLYLHECEFSKIMSKNPPLQRMLTDLFKSPDIVGD